MQIRRHAGKNNWTKLISLNLFLLLSLVLLFTITRHSYISANLWHFENFSSSHYFFSFLFSSQKLFKSLSFRHHFPFVTRQSEEKPYHFNTYSHWFYFPLTQIFARSFLESRAFLFSTSICEDPVPCFLLFNLIGRVTLSTVDLV